jgi:signal transduction histidine kinase
MRLERRVIPPAHPALAPPPPLEGRWLLIARAAWVAMAALLLVLFVVGLPASFTYLQTVCVSFARDPCPSPPPGTQALHGLGFSAAFYAAYYTALDAVVAVVYLAVAAIIFWCRSSERIALFCAFTLLTFGLASLPHVIPILMEVYPAWQPLLACLAFLSLALFTFFFYLFPDGRFVPRWTWALAIIPLGVLMPGIFWPYSVASTSTWPLLLVTMVLVVWLGSLLGVQVYRYRYASDALQRQQTKWVVFGITGTVLSLLLLSVLVVIIFPTFSPMAEREALESLVINTASRICFLLIPLCIGIAVLRYHLWDIDMLINRTLVYGLLTTFVTGLYVLIVGGLSTVFEGQGNLVISLVATALIAVLFQPLRDRLQRRINRLMYGERDDPYRILSRLGLRLEATLAPEQVLPTIVQTTAQALKLPYVAVTLKQDDALVTVASSGTATTDLVHLPLTYQGEHVGELLLAPRAPGEALSSADLRLLNDLARQAGVAVYAVRLTTSLQRLARDLQHWRTQLVTAREEERRRLRRDLHDGLGSVLTSLNLRAGAIRALLHRDSATAEGLVVEQQSTIRAAIADIRRLVYGLRPPALDELGLLGAIREQVAHAGMSLESTDQQKHCSGLLVEVQAPDDVPTLPAALEVATYRIVQEALSNVVRHAQARTCQIRLTIVEDVFQVEVTDDGRGVPSTHRVGIGLLSMRERAEELGGTCEIIPVPTGGTQVRARLPVLKEA